MGTCERDKCIYGKEGKNPKIQIVVNDKFFAIYQNEIDNIKNNKRPTAIINHVLSLSFVYSYRDETQKDYIETLLTENINMLTLFIYLLRMIY